MWLLNASTYGLELFEGTEVPEYAILSHRWGHHMEEVSFKEIGTPLQESKKGFFKIKSCCEQTLKDGHKYCWIDTCCIDKSSSAELSEAINSMFGWYKKSAICYAYLEDVKATNVIDSTWFTRGWTLQELIAPKQVRFYNESWQDIRTRGDHATIISEITGIPWPVLQGNVVLDDYSIAEKMKWAATRITTREEDMAYSLLGLFDVNMPLMYGEGRKSFERLQEHILRRCPDLSIFAWEHIDECSTTPLAPSPSAYIKPGSQGTDSRFSEDVRKDIVTLSSISPDFICSEGPMLLATGLAITLSMIPHRFGIFLAPVCSVYSSKDEVQSDTYLCIFLQRDRSDGHYRRVYLEQDVTFKMKFEDIKKNGKPKRIILASPLQTRYDGGIRTLHPSVPTVYGFEIDSIEPLAVYSVHTKHKNLAKTGKNLRAVSRPEASPGFLSISTGHFGIAGMVCLASHGQAVTLVFCLDFDFSPFCLMLRPDDAKSRHPNHWAITMTEYSDEPLNFGNNMHMLSLANWLRSKSHYHAQIEMKITRGNASLFWAPWSSEETNFEIIRGVRMTFRHITDGYKVSIQCLRRMQKFDVESCDNHPPQSSRTKATSQWTTRYIALSSAGHVQASSLKAITQARGKTGSTKLTSKLPSSGRTPFRKQT